MPGVRCATPGEKRLIEGVKVRRLPMLPDERGVLTEILRSDDAEFASFGQAYMTTTYPAVVKGWHYHERQTDMVCCLSGEIKLALYDARPQSETQGVVNEIFLGAVCSSRCRWVCTTGGSASGRDPQSSSTFPIKSTSTTLPTSAAWTHTTTTFPTTGRVRTAERLALVSPAAREPTVTPLRAKGTGSAAPRAEL